MSSLLGMTAARADAAAVGAAATDAPPSDPSTDQLQEVTVTGVRSLLHDKLAEDEQSAPQSISIIGQELIEQQADTRLEDALRNVPGITLNAGEGAARGDTVNLRGFSAFNDFYLDGIRDAAVYTRDSFDLQSVEVLEGPSAVLFGRGSTGGAINQVSKAPLLAPLDVVSAQFGTDDLYRATGDFDMPFAHASAARLNVMGETSHVADRELVANRRWGIAPAVSFGIGAPDTLTLAFLHQQEDDIPDAGVPFVAGQLPPIPREADFGLASDRSTANDDIGTMRYTHEFGSDLSLADTLRYARYEFLYHSTEPNFGSDVPGPGTPLDDILVGRDAPYSSGSQTNLDDQLDVTAHVATGWVTHTLVGGVEFARQTSAINRSVNPFNTDPEWVPQTPLLDPNPYEPLPGIEPVGVAQDTTAHSDSAYAIDTIGLGTYVELSLGMRYDHFDADYHQVPFASGAALDLQHADNVGSPRAALVFKPTRAQTYYLSYGTSFDPSAEALTLTTKTADLGPVRAKSFEAGAKTTLPSGLLLTAAVFRTEIDNAQTNDPDNPTLTVLEGNQRVDGIELEATGHITRHWEVTSGYTYLDGRTIASGTPAYVGKALPNAARNALNVWTEYELGGGWEAGIGASSQSRRFADSAETAPLPGYTIWNAMVSYQLTSDLELQLNGFNLLDKLYYAAPYYTSAAENHVIPGPGRSASLSIRLVL